MAEKKMIHLVVKRQEKPNTPSYTEEFKIAYQANMNVVSALMEVRKHPVNTKGKLVSPVIWESVCLEEVCGSCSMIINGQPRQACSTLIDTLDQPIFLAPLTSFPVVRDLMVDRVQLFDALKKVRAWIDIDGPFDLGSGPRVPEKTRAWAYELSKCMTCGCCFEACPNAHDRVSFIGPAALSQVRLFNAHPVGTLNKDLRLKEIMRSGGITSCGNSQNCVELCPKSIPLTTSIAHLNRETTVQSLKNFFGHF